MKRRPAVFVILTSKRSYSAVETDLKLFKPVAGGVGTVEDASAFWFELSRREPFTAPTLAEALTPDDTVREFRPTEEGAGYDLALQVPLIPRTEKGTWRSGIVGGGGVPVLERPTVSVSDEQLPLFG